MMSRGVLLNTKNILFKTEAMISSGNLMGSTHQF